MNDKLKRPLLLEQLEERIFLDANPLAAAADSLAGHAEPVETAAPEHTDTTASAEQHADTATTEQHTDEKTDSTAGSDAQASTTTGSTTTSTTPAQSTAEGAEQGEAHPTETQEQVTSPAAGQTDEAAADHPTATTTAATEVTTTATTAAEADHQNTDTSVHATEAPATETPAAGEAVHQDTTAADEHASTDDATADTHTATDSLAAQEATAETPAAGEAVLPEPEAPATEITQVVFVDNAVHEHEVLLNGVLQDIAADNGDSSDTSDTTLAGTRVVVLDAAGDEVQQITDILNQYDNLTSVHILSHGSENSLSLGSTTLDTTNLDQYTEQMSTWGKSLSTDGDILLYGCNIADNRTENSFIQAMATLTGADVAASNDPTGNTAHGGDWNLEVATGLIETKVLHDASGAWDGLLAPPDPQSISSASDTTPMINSAFTFTVSFDNDTSLTPTADVGYGPFVDVIVPVAITVADVTVFGNSITAETFTWNGTAWIDGDGAKLTEHPGETTGTVTDTNLAMPTGTNVGDTWYYIVQPFGSFTPNQPAIDVIFTATASTSDGAKVGVDYTIAHRAGFLFGDTATNDHGPIQEAGVETLTVTPQVIDIEKTNNAPDDQTVTGPNYPVEYTLTINVAAGQTVTDVVVQDYLPEGAVYRGDYIITPVSGHGAPSITSPTVTEPGAWSVLGSNSDDRLITFELGDLTGVANSDNGHTEWEITYSVYFSDRTAGGGSLLPATGNDVPNVINEASITGIYAGTVVSDGIDTTLGDLNTTDNDTLSDNQIEIASIVTYKDVQVVGGGAPVPGAILEWTIEVDISDYYAASNIVINDVLGDGQTMLATFTPTLSVHEDGVPSTYTFTSASTYILGIKYDNDTVGGTALTFLVSDLLSSQSSDGTLNGAAYNNDPSGAVKDGDALNVRNYGDATYAVITFRTIIDDNYGKLQNADGGSGDPSVDIGDRINNHVAVTATISDGTNTAPQTDGADAGVKIEGGDTHKEIFAINGKTLDANNVWVDNNGVSHDLDTEGISPGDTVTYRLTLTLPLADFENLTITDYLPLPVYDASELLSGSNTSDFNNGIELTAGEVEFGPSHNLDSVHFNNLHHNQTELVTSAIPPTVSVNANNAVTLAFGSYDSPFEQNPNAPDAVIDILLTVTITSHPMTDGLQLTNQAEWSFNNTTKELTTDDKIVQITLNEPDLHITKGIVDVLDNGDTYGTFSSNNDVDTYFTEPGTSGFRFTTNTMTSAWLAGHNIDTNLSAVDAGDTVTYAIVVENTGHAEAYDLTIKDALQTGYSISDVSNFRVSYGDGTLITTTIDDFFGAGITLTDTPGSGAIAGIDSNHDGQFTETNNIILITYDLALKNTTQPLQTLVNTATLTNYAGAEGGPDHTTTDLSDTATVTASSLVVDKVISGTGETSTDGTNVVIGETVSYTVTITVPEGTSQNVKLTDDLWDDLAFVSIDSITVSADADNAGGVDNIHSSAGTWTDILAAANSSLSAPGRSLSIDFGTITNEETDNDQPETITITYTTVVLNTSGNQQGVALNNDVYVSWTENSTTHEVSANAPEVQVQEAQLQVIKDVSNNYNSGTGTGTWVDNGHFDQNDSISYRITVQHSSASHEDAFDVLFTDTLPTGIDWSGATVTVDSGIHPNGQLDDVTDGVFTASWDHLYYNGSVSSPSSFQSTTFIITGGILRTATAGQVITNTGTVTWESLESDLTAPKSPYNTASVERSGDPADPGGAVNDYLATDPATITVGGTIDKLQPVPASYTIGDVVTYDIVVTLPEGTTNNLVVTDALPSGLQYQNSELVTLLADSSGHLSANFNYTGTNLAATVTPNAPGDGTDISWNITTDGSNSVGVTADNQAANNSFIIRVTALVTNNPASHGDPDGAGPGTATSLTNHASMTYTGGGATDGSNPIVTVIEPQITTTKSVADTDGNLTTAIAEPGETLTYTARFTNTGTSTAYEVTAEDKLPTGVQYNLGSATITGNSGVTSALDVTGVYDTTTQAVTFTSSDGGWDISVGGWVEVQYTVQVLAAGFTATPAHINTVDADWSSRNDADPNEREYTDQVDGNGNPLYTVDGVQDQAQATFTVALDGSIGDTVWFDSNADREQAGDATEPGISNVWVHLTADVDNNGTPELDRWIQTDANGKYLFENLAVFDNYVVTVDFDGTYAATHGGFDLEAAGYSQTHDLNGGLDHKASNVSITSAQPKVENVDFGYTGSQTVGDLVWYDGNGDGVQPNIDTNEAGLGGLVVTLNADIDGDGFPEYTDTTTTANDGSYHFDHLPGGSYTVSITPPAGGVVTYDQDSGTTNPNGSTTFTLPPTNGDRSDLDFGIRGAAQLGDRIFFDVNNNGSQDASDLGIAKVKVNLSVDIDGDHLVDYTTSVVTDDNGIYNFTGLLPGNYTVTVDQTTLPLGMHQTVDPDASLDSTHLQTLGTTDIDTVDFGYTGNGAIGDRVWWDGNGNSFQDTGEPGLAGVHLQLECDFDGDGTMEVIGAAITDSNGNYLFDHLPAASGYIVTVVSGVPAAATPTYDLDGIGSAGETTTNLTYNSTTGQVDRNLLVDFGYKGTGSIGDTIWNDLDNGGDQDAGEPGIAGVKVTLSADLDGLAGNGNEFVVRTVTDANGHYSFNGLFTSDIEYTVTVDPTTLPASVTPTYDYDGTGTANTAKAILTTATPNNDQVDFGYNISSSLGDRVWLDTDGDGVQDAGEHGLGGITVTLYDNNGAEVAHQTTGSDGQYLFNNLAAGSYTVTVSGLPEGLQQTYDRDGLATANTAAVTLGAPETNLSLDFGYRGTGSIGDRIWNDLDNGSDQDASEPGIAGVTVTLVGDLNHDGDLTDPEDTLTTTTDANGNYHFNGLFAGDYTVTVTNLPAGMVQTFDPDGTADGKTNVTLGGGNPMVTDAVDFGYHQSGTIGDRIWYDLNADGVQDAGELGLTGVGVSLYADSNGDGIADGPALKTTTTGADGLYSFDNLGAGSYLVEVSSATLPVGMRQTYDRDGLSSANIAAVTIGAAESNLTVDFGYTGTGSIGDTIWNDLDNGGDQDAGEPGLAGVKVILTGDFNNDGIQDQLTTITDADGHYSFGNLAANTYTVSVDPTTLPLGMAQTYDPQGALDNSAQVVLAAGGINNAIDFGYHQSGTIGDTIWYDLNANGIQDAGELGLANIRVTLTGDYDGDGDTDTLVRITDGNGHYSFTGLQAGSYTVSVDTTTLPGGMVQTGDPDATKDNTSTVILTTDAPVNFEQDFGYTGTGAIGDTIWYDFNNNGLEDAGEVGIPGITVTLTGDLDNDGQNDDSITLQTDQNGHYQFDRLPEGQYTITVDPAGLPGGMVASGDPDGVLDNTTAVALGAGETTLIQDFGYTGTGSVGDTIWNDRNGNGVQDPGEPGIGGVTVTIGVDLNGDGTPDFTTSATTDAGGQYLFDHLPAGSHTLHVDPATLPPGIRPSYDPDGTLDGTFTINLGAGENNRDVDFGYHFPAAKPPTPGTLTPVTPVQPLSPPESGFVADAFFMHRQFGTLLEFPFDRWMEITYPQPPLPVSPIYTGIAEPGTTLALTIYDASGNLVGSQTIMADTGGNWLASFPGVLLHEMPHDMKVEQRISLYNESTAGLFNMRTYFNPNSTSLIKTSTTLDVESVFDYLPSTIMDSVHSSLYSGFNIRWNNFNGYEFFATSINPAETGR